MRAGFDLKPIQRNSIQLNGQHGLKAKLTYRYWRQLLIDQHICHNPSVIAAQSLKNQAKAVKVSQRGLEYERRFL